MEDDDLEFLRLTALKSLQSKKTQSKVKVGNAIKVVESINSVPSANKPYFAPVNHPTPGARIQTLVNNNENSTINDPYLSQRRDVITPWVEPDFGVPYSVSAPATRTIIPNVQLSPRSAAFVSQNNDILNRRKVYASPNRDRSRSPNTPSRYTPGRWSVSPPQYKNVNLRPNYEQKGVSRSPIHRDKSPIFRRSPLPATKCSPKKSRSPLPLKVRKSPLRKSLSISPHRNDRHPSPSHTRNRSPAGRYTHNQKNHRRYSPTQNRSYNRKQVNARRSLSPRNNGHHAFQRSSKSPVNNSRRSPVNNSRRSRSKSPNRIFSGRSNRGDRVNKRRSPLYNRKSNRNSNRSKRKSSRSPSPFSKRKVDKSQNSHHQQNNDDKKILSIEEKNKIEKMDDAPATTEKPEPTNEKTNIENDASASSDDDKSSDENEDDGIDLFASEESESENEGRFKSNSGKNVRSNNVATVSFSKLGNATTSALGDLNEVKSDKNSGSSHNREDRYKRGSNYSNRKDDRSSKKYGSSRNEENRYGDGRSSYKSRHTTSSASTIPKVAEEKKKDDKSMFKSTFQVLPSELKSEAVKSTPKPTVSSRISPIVKDKAGDKKLITLKRPAEPLVDEQVDEEIEKVTSSTSVENAKKSVHARLGAPTKTWKNKKSWRTEKVSQNIFYVKIVFTLHFVDIFS